MKVLSAQQIREWDEYTIEHEPILSIDLMERAAATCVQWILNHYPERDNFSIFCGKGNNGGDGLAIARMLMEKKFVVTVYILEFGHIGTADFQSNLARLHMVPGHDIHFIQTEENFHPFVQGEIIIDALYGSGLNRKLEGVTSKLVDHINTSGCVIISIDIPSGLFVDLSSNGIPCIHASHTLGFQCYKPAFLFAENEIAVGRLHILDIVLSDRFYSRVETAMEMLDMQMIRSIYRPRKPFSHKGSFGHALIIAGSYGKMGAAVLTTKACLRSGAGLVSCHIPASGYSILQTAVPEAMALVDTHAMFNTHIDVDIKSYNVIGIGPGIGTAKETQLLLKQIFEINNNPVILDADALNCIAADNELLKLIAPGSILTPHPKEFDRLFGASSNDFERAALAIQKAKELQCIIVLKGHHTLITSEGVSYFNSTGNAGMATAGSGDVLTGIITGLLAQRYSSIEAAILGVYLHGLAGDLVLNSGSQESLIAGDIIESLGAAFKKIAIT